jgi:hypothetical protein
MAYREKPETFGFDWVNMVLDKLAGRADAEYFSRLVEATDNLQCQALIAIAEEDISDLLQLYGAAEKSSIQCSYYQYYRQVLGKMITDVMDIYPEKMLEMSDSQRNSVLNMKLETPNLLSLAMGVFDYLEGKLAMPAGTLATGRDFHGWLRDMAIQSKARTNSLPHLSGAFEEYRKMASNLGSREA